MTWVATAVVGSAAVGLYSANKAAGAQEAAAGQAAGISREQYAQTRADQEPWRLAGERALGKLEGASEYTPFGMAQFQADPGYGFRLSEGQKALDRQAAARGGLISGGALKAAQRYGQEMGSQEYTNAFNRYQTERQAKLGPLQSLAGVGQTAVNQLATAGQNYATSASEAAGAAGQARASGYMGGANAISGGVGSYLGYQSNTNLVNALNARNVGAVVGPTNMSQQGYAIQSGGY